MSITSDEFGQKTLNAIREALENDLEQITPEEAVEQYLDERRRDLCLTAELDAGIPGEILSDRYDLSKEFLEKHYDERSKRQKRTLREKVFAEVHEKADGGYHSNSDFNGGEFNV